jgi:type I restriction enzyme S subunit
MKPWPTVRLGEVLQRSEETIELQPDAEYRQITVRLWGKGVVLRGVLTGAEIAASRQMVARRGQFILSRIDARNGALGIVPPELDEAIVTNDFPVFNVHEIRLLPAYLGWMCRTASFVEECKRASEGTTNRVRLQEDKFLAREIPLPPLPEQRRVVARIEELAAQIHEARTLRHQAAEEAAVLMESWSRRILGTLEKPEWKLIELQSVCSVFIDCDHKTPDYLEEGIALLRPRDIKPESLTIAGTVRISEAEHEKRCERHRPVEGDIVYSRELSFGNAAMIPRDCVVSLGQGTMLVRADETKIEKRFLLKALNAPIIREQAAKAAKGAAHPHVNLKDIRVFGLPVPPLANQRRILAELDDLQAQVDALKRLQAETATELDALLPAILDRAFKGEL